MVQSFTQHPSNGNGSNGDNDGDGNNDVVDSPIEETIHQISVGNIKNLVSLASKFPNICVDELERNLFPSNKMYSIPERVTNRRKKGFKEYRQYLNKVNFLKILCEERQNFQNISKFNIS